MSKEERNALFKGIYIPLTLKDRIDKECLESGLRKGLNLVPESRTDSCDFDHPFRRIDGKCNNEENQDWGKSNTFFQRKTELSYEGIQRFWVCS